MLGASLAVLTLLSAAAEPAPGLVNPPPDLVEGIPADFVRFEIPGHDEAAQLLNRYFWHHFSSRGGTGLTLFNKEYLTTAEMWAAGAVHPRESRPIQETHRQLLLEMRLDPDGYVHTHQHFSHAHETGWPFPLWVQVPGGFQGVTWGWHFQDEPGPAWQWLWGMLHGWQGIAPPGEAATRGWTLEDLRSEGIAGNRWRLAAAGPAPALISPATVTLDAFNGPFLQLRWNRTGAAGIGAQPFVEFMRTGDDGFAADRRVYFDLPAEADGVTGTRHCLIPMHEHPLWKGAITRLRLALAPGAADAAFEIDSLFTCYDTRHTINNPILILASREVFRWTGDVAFLRQQINRLRTALRYQQTVMGGLRHQFIRNPWVGHDGIAGYRVQADGSKSWRPGHGIGNNYWDLMPFGGDDFYATAQYYAATLAMAELEEAALANPGWDIPGGALALDPVFLRQHAAQVKETANRVFWDGAKGRFIACIDAEGARHDYGYTFLNLDAIWYGIATDDHARAIMEWIAGHRVVEGDTSTGGDIYHWRFGPRASTVRNIEWYGQGWTAPESIPWGGQIQDGGAVLGFAFYDLWARLHVMGPDDAWARLSAILDWERDVQAEGGYREYYRDGRRGTTLQGGGTAGGIGIDHEFYESVLIPAIITRGFLGLEPVLDGLRLSPRLPRDCPEMAVRGVLYRGMPMDLRVRADQVTVALRRTPADPIVLILPGAWKDEDSGQMSDRFDLSGETARRFRRTSE